MLFAAGGCSWNSIRGRKFLDFLIILHCLQISSVIVIGTVGDNRKIKLFENISCGSLYKIPIRNPV